MRWDKLAYSHYSELQTLDLGYKLKQNQMQIIFLQIPLLTLVGRGGKIPLLGQEAQGGRSSAEQLRGCHSL